MKSIDIEVSFRSSRHRIPDNNSGIIRRPILEEPAHLAAAVVDTDARKGISYKQK